MVQKILEEFGNPLVGVSMNYKWLFKTLNHLGIIILQPYIQNLLKFSESVLTDQKGKLIDGENPSTLTEAFLYKIQQTSDPNDPFYADIGELNLINILVDMFMA